jgi:hypothetical protein
MFHFLDVDCDPARIVYERSKTFRGTKLAQNRYHNAENIGDLTFLVRPHNLKVIGSNPIPATKIDGWSFSLIESRPSGRLSRFRLYAATKLATAGGIAISNFSASH